MKNIEIINLENAANTPIVKDLRGLLNSLVVKDLRFICDLFNLSAMSNKPKKELVEAVYEQLTTEEGLIKVIERFIDSEFDLFKKLLKNKGIIQDNFVSINTYHYLYILGLVFLFKRENKFYISMTEDVFKIASNLDLDKFEPIIKDNSTTYWLLYSMINLYGVVSMDDLIDTYNQYYSKNEYSDIPLNALYVTERMDSILHIYTEDNSYFIKDILNIDQFEETFLDIINRQKQIDRKKIELKKLLQYKDISYYESTASIEKFKKYLNTKSSVDIVEEIIRNIISIFKLGNVPIAIILDMLNDYNIKFNESEMQTILNYLMGIYNNTRIWPNNGWTPVEMRKNY